MLSDSNGGNNLFEYLWAKYGFQGASSVMTKRTRILLLLAAMLGLSLASWAKAAQSVSVVFSLKTRLDLGSGVALSHDAKKLAYVGEPMGALHVVTIKSGQDLVVFKGLGDAMMINRCGHPSFSPDGERIAFSLSGASMSFPSDIFSILLDGTGLKQLTHSDSEKPSGERFPEYYYAPTYSPDGSEILVWKYDNSQDDENYVNDETRGRVYEHPEKIFPKTAEDYAQAELKELNSAVIMSADGSRMRVATKGKPLGWAASGKAIFVLREEQRTMQDPVVRHVLKYDLASGKTQSVNGLDDILNDLENNAPLGKLQAEDTFAIDNNGSLGLVTVTDVATGPIRILPLPTTTTLEVDDLKALRPNLKPEVLSTVSGLPLVEVSSDMSGSYLVLFYRGYIAEVLQVVKIK